MKQRREKVLQNAKDRKLGKANAPVALQASKKANGASKDTQIITMTDNAATGGDNIDDAATSDDNIDNATTGRDNIEDAATSDDNTDDAATGDDNMDNAVIGEARTVHVPLPPHYRGKAKDPSQIKTSLKHATAIAELSTGNSLPDSQATMKASGHTFELGNVHICHASARPPVSQSTAPHFPSSLDGMRNQKAQTGLVHWSSIIKLHPLNWTRPHFVVQSLSQSEAFPPSNP